MSSSATNTDRGPYVARLYGYRLPTPSGAKEKSSKANARVPTPLFPVGYITEMPLVRKIYEFLPKVLRPVITSGTSTRSLKPADGSTISSHSSGKPEAD